MTAHRRLLFVDHAGVMGGAEFSLLDVVGAFLPGSEVMLLADGPFRVALEARGVPVQMESLGALGRVKKRGTFPPIGALADAARVGRRLAARTHAFDALYANSQKAFIVSAAAGWWSRCPVIWHLRDILGAPHFSDTNVRAVVWLANRCAVRVIANSRATAAAFQAAGGNASRVRVVHNGIDPAPFDAVTDHAARECRQALGVPGNVPLVLHVGRFHHWKGQQILLRALAQETRAHAWIVGASLFGEEEFAIELRAEAAQRGLADRVHFLGFRDDVPLLMKAADIVVHSSVYPEPFGRVVVEGMLAGRPVIAAAAGGVTEIITDGETGWLVPPNDPASLAQALGRAIDNPQLAAGVAARGAAHARQVFTREAMIRGVTEAVESLATSAR